MVSGKLYDMYTFGRYYTKRMSYPSLQDVPPWFVGAKRLIKKAGISYKALLPVFDVTSVSAVSHYMNGRRQPRPDQLKRLADCLGVKIDDFFAQDASDSALSTLRRLSSQGTVNDFGSRYDWPNHGRMDDETIILKVLRRAVFADVLALSRRYGMERISRFAENRPELAGNPRLRRILANIETGIERAQSHAV